MVYYYRFPQNGTKIHDTTVVENLEDSRKLVTKRDEAEKADARANLPSKYWPSEYDRGPLMRDETWMQFVDWRMRNEEDQSREYVPMQESRGIMIPAEAEELVYSKGGLIMPDSTFDVNFRDVGKWLQYCHNTKQDFIDFILPIYIISLVHLYTFYV